MHSLHYVTSIKINGSHTAKASLEKKREGEKRGCWILFDKKETRSILKSSGDLGGQKSL